MAIGIVIILTVSLTASFGFAAPTEEPSGSQDLCDVNLTIGLYRNVTSMSINGAEALISYPEPGAWLAFITKGDKWLMGDKSGHYNQTENEGYYQSFFQDEKDFAYRHPSLIIYANEKAVNMQVNEDDWELTKLGDATIAKGNGDQAAIFNVDFMPLVKHIFFQPEVVTFVTEDCKYVVSVPNTGIIPKGVDIIESTKDFINSPEKQLLVKRGTEVKLQKFLTRMNRD